MLVHGNELNLFAHTTELNSLYNYFCIITLSLLIPTKWVFYLIYGGGLEVTISGKRRSDEVEKENRKISYRRWMLRYGVERS